MAEHTRLSGVVTTFNNAATLEACLASLSACDEIIVLDSRSTDDSRAIAERHGARVFIEDFKGYGRQKQSAVDKAGNDWVLLLDADERLAPGSAERIAAALRAPGVDGFRLPRREWLFWQWPHPGTRSTWQLRLFRRSAGGLNDVPVHAAPEVRGRTRDLSAPFLHYGEPEIAVRVDKVNRYSSGLVAHRRARGTPLIGLRLVLYPPLVFLRFYFGKRYFLSGWAGFIAARVQAFYALLKLAKQMEAARRERG
jgi:glycosyltransferase involved in cell wall biosynthesis